MSKSWDRIEEASAPSIGISISALPILRSARNKGNCHQFHRQGIEPVATNRLDPIAIISCVIERIALGNDIVVLEVLILQRHAIAVAQNVPSRVGIGVQDWSASIAQKLSGHELSACGPDIENAEGFAVIGRIDHDRNSSTETAELSALWKAIGSSSPTKMRCKPRDD